MRACTRCGRIYAASHLSATCAECDTALSALPLSDVMRLARERRMRLRAEYERRRASR
jgi:hypothetical protein